MSEQRKQFWLGISLSLVANVVAFGLFLWTAGGKVATAEARLERVEQRMASVEQRTESDHDILIDLRNDMRWVTRAMGKPEKGANP